MLPRPGDLTSTFKGEAIDIYSEYPVDNQIAGLPREPIDKNDGLIFVIAHVGDWCFVLTSSMKIGWIYDYDVGAGGIAGSVYSIK